MHTQHLCPSTTCPLHHSFHLTGSYRIGTTQRNSPGSEKAFSFLIKNGALCVSFVFLTVCQCLGGYRLPVAIEHCISQYPERGGPANWRQPCLWPQRLAPEDHGTIKMRLSML
ncbi:hypothetical protein BC826DRAFT_1026852 [Russula brevipes]|nr:hypothetical protein BC826DRAFT_1026852 [Russula brevipes]